jgi:hypothetical protein
MHFLVYTQGLLMYAIVHVADIQDHDGGVLVTATLFGLYPFLLELYADAGDQGPKFQPGLAQACREVNDEIMRRCDTGKFVVLPKRVRRSAPNRRTHHRLTEPLPAPEQGLGVPEPKRPRNPPVGVGSTDAAKALLFINMIFDGL